MTHFKWLETIEVVETIEVFGLFFDNDSRESWRRESYEAEENGTYILYWIDGIKNT